jgi:hypothetical protein
MEMSVQLCAPAALLPNYQPLISTEQKPWWAPQTSIAPAQNQNMSLTAQHVTHCYIDLELQRTNTNISALKLKFRFQPSLYQ